MVYMVYNMNEFWPDNCFFPFTNALTLENLAGNLLLICVSNCGNARHFSNTLAMITHYNPFVA